MTGYTELNAESVRRTGLPGFDFGQQVDRAAIGHPLWRIVEQTRPETGLMISALVRYKNEPDTGSGFYGLAADYGLLPRNASADRRLAFWNDQVKKPYAHYAPSR